MTSTPSKPATKTVKKSATKKTTAAKPATKAVKKVATKKAVPPATKKPAAKKAATKAAAKPAPDRSDLIADLAVAALEDMKGVEIRRLDVRGLTTVTDVMIIATGTSNRHAASLAHSVIDKAKEAGHRPVGIEGINEGEWVLVNLGGVIVHVMQAQPRAFYQLEKLWDFQVREPAERSA